MHFFKFTLNRSFDKLRWQINMINLILAIISHFKSNFFIILRNVDCRMQCNTFDNSELYEYKNRLKKNYAGLWKRRRMSTMKVEFLLFLHLFPSFHEKLWWGCSSQIFGTKYDTKISTYITALLFWSAYPPMHFTVDNIKIVYTENVRFLYKRLSDAANKTRYFYVKRKIQNYLLRIHEF